MPGVHDRGGWPTDEPIDKSDHPVMDWEVRISAVLGALRGKGLIGTDELRRGIESIEPSKYESLGYYERWAESVESILEEKGILTREELDRKMAEICGGRGLMAAYQRTPAYGEGGRVRVLDLPVKGHNRTPWYIRGKVGTVERYHGAYRNPESLAYGGSGEPVVPLYLVRFSQRELWENYDGPESDELLADVFEHWLEPAW